MNTTNKEILIGCDPELFVFSENKRRIVSAHDLLPGTKREPFAVPRGAIQVDGVAAEFNIEPAKNGGEFCQNIAVVKNEIQTQLDIKGRLNKDKYTLRAKPCVFFTKTYWATVPEEAKELGCEPDFDAYTMKANPRPDGGMLMRTGGGHIHISWGDSTNNFTDEWVDMCADLVRHLDHHLFPQSKKWDNDDLRRRLYGKEGAFRPKKFGVEYRPLSNAWLNDYKTVQYIFNATKYVTEKWLANVKKEQYKLPDYV